MLCSSYFIVHIRLKKQAQTRRGIYYSISREAQNGLNARKGGTGSTAGTRPNAETSRRRERRSRGVPCADRGTGLDQEDM